METCGSPVFIVGVSVSNGLLMVFEAFIFEMNKRHAWVAVNKCGMLYAEALHEWMWHGLGSTAHVTSTVWRTRLIGRSPFEPHILSLALIKSAITSEIIQDEHGVTLNANECDSTFTIYISNGALNVHTSRCLRCAIPLAFRIRASLLKRGSNTRKLKATTVWLIK